MHARVGGDADPARPAVVMIHGLSISSRYMAPLACELARDVRAYAIDLPGFGRSAKPAAVLDIPAMAEVTLTWMDAVGLERATLLGNSIGSQVALQAAAHHPARVDGLVLTGLALGGRRQGVLLPLLRALADVPREPLSLWPLQAVDFVAAGPRRVLRTFRYGLAYRMEPVLPSVDVPALVVEGGNDPMDDRAWNQTVARLLPRAQLVQIEDGTHGLPYSRPAELARLVRTFLADLGSVPRSG